MKIGGEDVRGKKGGVNGLFLFYYLLILFDPLIDRVDGVIGFRVGKGVVDRVWAWW